MRSPFNAICAIGWRVIIRSNVCPEIDSPATPSFYAFSYTVPSEDRTARSFVAAGSGEAREGGPSYEGRIIRRGDQSPEAMREKARFVRIRR